VWSAHDPAEMSGDREHTSYPTTGSGGARNPNYPTVIPGSRSVCEIGPWLRKLTRVTLTYSVATLAAPSASVPGNHAGVNSGVRSTSSSQASSKERETIVPAALMTVDLSPVPGSESLGSAALWVTPPLFVAAGQQLLYVFTRTFEQTAAPDDASRADDPFSTGAEVSATAIDVSRGFAFTPGNAWLADPLRVAVAVQVDLATGTGSRMGMYWPFTTRWLFALVMFLTLAIALWMLSGSERREGSACLALAHGRGRYNLHRRPQLGVKPLRTGCGTDATKIPLHSMDITPADSLADPICPTCETETDMSATKASGSAWTVWAEMLGAVLKRIKHLLTFRGGCRDKASPLESELESLCSHEINGMKSDHRADSGAEDSDGLDGLSGSGCVHDDRTVGYPEVVLEARDAWDTDDPDTDGTAASSFCYRYNCSPHGTAAGLAPDIHQGKI
jgi:hypothetical protein